MKVILPAIIILFVLKLPVAQNQSAVNMFIDEGTGLYTYKEVIEEQGTKDELYNRCASWLHVYFANESFTDEIVSTSDNTELIGIIEQTDAYQYTSKNSSYYMIQFSTNETGYVGNTKMTSDYSFIFDRDTGSNG